MKPRLTSFSKALQIGSLIGFLSILFAFLALFNWYHQEQVSRRVNEDKQWLETYLHTLLPDYFVGNTIAIERKVKYLARNPLYDSIRLSLGHLEIAIDSNNVRPTIGKDSFFSLLRRNFFSVEIKDNDGSKWGSLSVDLNPEELHSTYLSSLLSVFSVFLGILLVFFGFWTIYLGRVSQEISLIQIHLSSLTESEPPTTTPAIHTNELNHILSVCVDVMNRLSSAKDNLRKVQVMGELNNLAQQLAHDIRSPIAALNSSLVAIEQLPEDKRILIRSAINRIKDIANNLLVQYKSGSGAISEKPIKTAEAIDVQLISSLIESIVSEKRLQYKSRIGLEIVASIDSDSYGLFARVQSIEFKRIISNLINNAAESIASQGQVSVSLRDAGEDIEIAISDNGKGIPNELIPKITERGFTFGKTDGSGLGLYHANAMIQSWGGLLKIVSEVNTGTVVILHVPKAPSPVWFLESISVSEKSNLIIVDDDQSIHQIWRDRAESEALDRYSIELCHFSTPGELVAWRSKKPNAECLQLTFLIDYEFVGAAENGLDIIESLDIAEQSILVTSRFEEAHILERCLRLGVKMIPKGMAGFVPVKVETTPSRSGPILDAVLVDDDSMIHTTWKLSAHESGKNLRTFKSGSNLVDQIHQIPADTPIYIDSNLANGEKGEILAEQLHGKGFTQIYLATGHEPSLFSHLTWLKGVVGKDPPWG